jgi:hypothetical protein
MDDLQKQRIKNIDKVVCPVVNSVNNSLDRLNLEKLELRRLDLLLKFSDPDLTELNRESLRLKLDDVEASIMELKAKLVNNVEIDLHCDEKAAKKFLEDNPGIIEDEDFIYD